MGRQVAVRTSAGLRIASLLVRKPGGKMIQVEVKTGGGIRTAGQVTKDLLINRVGGKVVGKRAPAF